MDGEDIQEPWMIKGGPGTGSRRIFGSFLGRAKRNPPPEPWTMINVMQILHNWRFEVRRVKCEKTTRIFAKTVLEQYKKMKPIQNSPFKLHSSHFKCPSPKQNRPSGRKTVFPQPIGPHYSIRRFSPSLSFFPCLFPSGNTCSNSYNNQCRFRSSP